VEHKKELNSIDQVLMMAKQGTENYCQKLKSGQVKWCPWVMVAINQILLWKSILKRELGGKVGLSVLRKHTKKAGVDSVPYLGTYPIPVLKELISKAYKNFWHLKQDDTWCNTWIAQLIWAQAVASKCHYNKSIITNAANWLFFFFWCRVKGDATVLQGPQSPLDVWHQNATTTEALPSMLPVAFSWDSAATETVVMQQGHQCCQMHSIAATQTPS